MKKTLLAGLSVVGLLAAGSAMAADLPSRTYQPAAPVAAVPLFTWTGFYAGVNAGYGFGDFTRDGGILFDEADGFIAGGQIGYNYQIGQFVVGLEGDLQYSDISASPSGTGLALGLGGSDATINYFGTIRGRLGVAFDRALVYATGGYAFGEAEVSIPGIGSDDNMHNGWALGAGIEYAFTNNLTAKAEYLYVDLENKNFTPGPGVTARAGAEFSVVRAGLNYKF